MSENNNLSNFSKELLAYRTEVINIADSETENSRIFLNHGPDHAAIVCTEIFKRTKKTVNIYSRQMSGMYSTNPDYLYAFKELLKNDVKVNILVDNSDSLESNKSEFLKKIKNIELIDKIKFKKATPDFREDLSNLFVDKKLHYFTIADNKMFRLEKHDSPYAAFICFNNENVSAKVLSIYDKYFNQLERVNPYVN
ncbi:MAG: hypothetical protein EAZ53_11850 [Bacteroidetes bacterium]|nr:MAG: hypothetical protein EAZ53_11850 [Bacteroidota bacterium]